MHNSLQIFLFYLAINSSSVARCASEKDNVGDEVTCGKSNIMMSFCLKNLTISQIELLSSIRIANTMEEIEDTCLIFNRIMDCIEKYVDKCISRKIIYENSVYGARTLYRYLCKNAVFQRELLRHNQCLNAVQKDWDNCANTFNENLRHEFSKADLLVNIEAKYRKICCTRFAFEECVHENAKLKCRLDSADFVKKIAKLLSTEKQLVYCDRIKFESCSSASRNVHYVQLLIALLGLIFLF